MLTLRSGIGAILLTFGLALQSMQFLLSVEFLAPLALLLSAQLSPFPFSCLARTLKDSSSLVERLLQGIIEVNREARVPKNSVCLGNAG
jgi:hypothetical protein